MKKTEAEARIKINKLLHDSGWCFENSKRGPSNIILEPGVDLEDLGKDFEKTKKGYIDFLLIDKDKRPLVVVEAKSELINPLIGKEQARAYARNVGARFIILSNGNIHYLWDTKHGNPETISRFPTQESLSQYQEYKPNPAELASAKVDKNYIIQSQMPGFEKDPAFHNEKTREQFLRDNHLTQLRPYQVNAIHALQESAKSGNNRFLFEMATGTGKTLISAATIKLFLKTGNAQRVLFLVDRLELETQAYKAFKALLGKDYTTVIYKEKKDSWMNAHIVVSTIQTFMSNDRYRKEFSPTDFEFVISDEAHRSIGGNSRVVFEYFVGYKLGLTATPKDYLKGFDHESSDSQREFERRQLLDTYKTFGCESGEPTFRYDLLSGVKDGYLINPVIVDARTEITTKLLSEKGYAVHGDTQDGEEINAVYDRTDYEKKFVNDETNVAMCKSFMENALLDPMAFKLGIELFGKSIVFCVSQSHAAKITNILNKFATEKWPDIYDKSDFAVQVTSFVHDAQQMTINFANNTLNGKVGSPEGYDSSKTRVCVTVGMMTTGYDCQDLLNIGLMRPVFSPSDFVQIKGRGTRKYDFEHIDYESNETESIEKDKFKFFDFFATCEYFENDFDYDEKLKLPRITKVLPPVTYEGSGSNKKREDDTEYIDETGGEVFKGPIDIQQPDRALNPTFTPVDGQGMRIDREGFRRAVTEDILEDDNLRILWENGDIAEAEEYTKKQIIDKPNHFITLAKVKKIFGIDRRLTIKELLQFAFGDKDRFEQKDELMEIEWEKFMEIHEVSQDQYSSVKHYFKSYINDPEVREIIDTKRYAALNTSPVLSFEEYKECGEFQKIIPQYVKDYISLNTFMN